MSSRSARTLAVYCSSHGWGHAVRTAAVLEQVAALAPDLRVVVSTAAPAFLFRKVTERGARVREQALDFGLVQHDPRVFSLGDTAARLETLLADADATVAREAAFLRDEGADAVFCDIPFLACEAAAQAGLPCVGMANFTWDWIYEYYAAAHPAFARAAERARRSYASCDLFLALPECAPLVAFPRVEAVPLVARTSTLSREEARRRLGIRPGQRAVLIGFAALQLPKEARQRLEALADTVFVVPAPLRLELRNALHADVAVHDFPALVRASDAVVTKLGYGIVSDALAAGVPLLETDRGDFPEVPYLRRLAQQVGVESVDREAFEAGGWDAALRRLRARTPDVRVDGARVVAERVLETLRACKPSA